MPPERIELNNFGPQTEAKIAAVLEGVIPVHPFFPSCTRSSGISLTWEPRGPASNAAGRTPLSEGNSRAFPPSLGLSEAETATLFGEPKKLSPDLEPT